MAATMKLLHVSDLHFRVHWFEWVAAQAAQFDAVCFSGDLLDVFPNASIGLRAQCKWMRTWLGNFPGRMYVCSGNHDWWPPQEHVSDNDTQGGWLKKAAGPKVRVDGTSEIFQGYRFVCCPWFGVPVVPGSEPAVVLVHAPPLGTPLSSDLGHEAGDPEVTAAVMKLPAGSFVLSGHIHDPKRWCHRLGPAWCFNPGVDFQALEPNHIVIDTAAGEAEFHGRGSIQWVSLAIKKR